MQKRNLARGAFALAALVAVAVPVPASAEPTKTIALEIPADVQAVSYLAVDEAGNRLKNVSVRIEQDGAKRLAVFEIGPQGTEIVCVAYGAPTPTYSGSNHRMQYGLKANCNRPISLRVTMALWSGPTKDTITNWQDSTPWKYGTGTVYQDRDRKCVDWGGYHYWRLFMYAQGDANYDGAWENFVPYPGKATEYEQCADIA